MVPPFHSHHTVYLYYGLGDPIVPHALNLTPNPMTQILSVRGGLTD